MPDRPKRRWYHLTPDRFLVGLLLVVGVLFLSEWFCWFPFNERKGWTVLIAIATVCGAVPLLLVWFIVAMIFRQRFQFSIRSLLVFVLLCALVCSWFAVKMKQARRQREVVAAIRGKGVWVRYTYEGVYSPILLPKPPAPAWLVNLFGVDFFEDVSAAFCMSPKSGFDDENMMYLSELSKLKALDLGGTQVTDSGLEHVKGLTSLYVLYVNDTQVTDMGLEQLKGLTGIGCLSLEGTQVTDAGLKHLKYLTNLRWLSLENTKVTDEGVTKLQEALPKCDIYHYNPLPSPSSPTPGEDAGDRGASVDNLRSVATGQHAVSDGRTR